MPWSTSLRAPELKRSAFLLLLLFFGSSGLLAAQDCPNPAYRPLQSGEQLTDWHATYVRPFRTPAGGVDAPSLTKDQVESLIEQMRTFHQRSLGDSLWFESLVQKITANYAGARDFRGLNTPVAERLSGSERSKDLDFSALCIDTRRSSSADDTFGITLFGLIKRDCEHVSLRGLVFSDALINGTVNGECRPDHIYYKRIIFPITAGTNTITFLCRKDGTGCARH
jgi:hypothetical protein